jgi:hypothetical protein
MERDKRGAFRFTLISGAQLAAVLASVVFIAFFYLKFRVPKICGITWLQPRVSLPCLPYIQEPALRLRGF